MNGLLITMFGLLSANAATPREYRQLRSEKVNAQTYSLACQAGGQAVNIHVESGAKGTFGNQDS